MRSAANFLDNAVGPDEIEGSVSFNFTNSSNTLTAYKMETNNSVTFNHDNAVSTINELFSYCSGTFTFPAGLSSTVVEHERVRDDSKVFPQFQSDAGGIWCWNPTSTSGSFTFNSSSEFSTDISVGYVFFPVKKL